MRLNVIADATLMEDGHASFVRMLLDRLCINFVSILTNSYALSFVHTVILRLCNFQLHKHSFGIRSSLIKT
jgi:hypothetical protein